MAVIWAHHSGTGGCGPPHLARLYTKGRERNKRRDEGDTVQMMRTQTSGWYTGE